MREEGHSGSRLLVGLGQLALAAALVWLGGFVWFALNLPRSVADPERRTDGIVVLTGGSERLAVGLELLAAGKGKKLFVSGVFHTTGREELQQLSRQAPELFECCVDLGKQAVDTVGNAKESTEWARREGYRSLRVVTAGYHMPRSLVELGRAMPDVELVPNPVFPDHVKLDEWWAWPGTTALMAAEFSKYLVSLARTRLLD